MPIGCGFVALAVLLYGYVRQQLDPLAVSLSVANDRDVFIRMALSFSDNARLLERTRWRCAPTR